MNKIGYSMYDIIKACSDSYNIIVVYLLFEIIELESLVMTLESRVLQVLFRNVTVLNGDETEEDLNMLISEKIVQRNIENIKKNLVVEQLQSEDDIEKLEDLGVFVYKYESLDNWKFTKHDTIADAVRAAVKDINSIILYRGKTITYDTINSKSAYYIDSICNKIKVVAL